MFATGGQTQPNPKSRLATLKPGHHGHLAHKASLFVSRSRFGWQLANRQADNKPLELVFMIYPSGKVLSLGSIVTERSAPLGFMG